MLTRIIAVAVFPLLTMTAPARAYTLTTEYINLDFGNGYTANGSITLSEFQNFFGNSFFPLTYSNVSMYLDGSPLAPYDGRFQSTPRPRTFGNDGRAGVKLRDASAELETAPLARSTVNHLHHFCDLHLHHFCDLENEDEKNGAFFQDHQEPDEDEHEFLYQQHLHQHEL